MKLFRKMIVALATLGLVYGQTLALAAAASIPLVTGPMDSPRIELNNTINAINSGLTPQSLASFSAQRNFLDNGAMAIAQRGTGAQTGGTTTGCVLTAYVADRWCVDTNVGSGAGKGQVVTATPTPLIGFQNSMTVWRDSGVLLQPVCAVQEVETARSVQLQGQPATFSFYAQALAGMAADNGSVLNAYIIYGTGTDQGLGTLTASPAITPAWTGINSSITQAFTLTTAWARYSLTGSIPSTAKEIGVMLCFTPTAGGAGTTDGFAFVGAQLEQGNAASAFDFSRPGVDLALAQRFYFRYAELAAAYAVNGACQATGANTNACMLALPQQMRSIPTITITTAGTFKVNIAGSLTTIASPTAAACGLNTCQVTAANTNTAGQVELLTGAAGGTGVWEVSADF